MASLGEPLKLHQINALTGLHEHIDGQTVVITSGGRHVIAYDIKSMKVQTTWSVKSKNRSTLSCPASFSASNERYIAVVDKQIVRLWDSPDQELDKAPKFTTQHPIHRIFPLASWSPVIIYDDGRLAWLDEPAEAFGQSLQQGTQMIWCGVQQAGNKYILVICCNSKGKTNLLVYNLRKDGEKDVKPLNITLNNGLTTSATYCLHVEKGSVYLIQLSSNGDLYRTCVSGQMASGTSILHTIPGCHSHTAVTSLGHTHLALAGCRDGKSGEDGVCIWDMKFAVSQAWKPLPSNNQTILQVYVLHGQLVIFCGGALYGYRFQAPPARLGEALGKLCHAEIATQSQIKEQSGEYVQSLLETLLMPAVYPGTHKFQTVFQKFHEIARKNQQIVLLLQPLVSKLLTRCIAEKKHWPSTVISELIKLGAVTSSESSMVIQALCDHGELISVGSCLHHIQDLPEKSLIQALAFFIRSSDEEFRNVTDEEMVNHSNSVKDSAEISSPFIKPKANFVNQVLCQPINNVFLIDYLRKMDFSLCLDLLHYLYYLLVTTPAMHEDVDVVQQPTLLQVADWMNALVDAHFPQLVLSTDARQLLIQLHESLTTQVKFYDELTGLDGILYQLRKKSALPQKQTPGVYCIQTLHVY